MEREATERCQDWNLICPFHNSAYDQSGFKKLNVIYANDLNANLFLPVFSQIMNHTFS